ncbi:SEL1-like repeat protein [Xanthomonas graminis]|uniref:hypothetical protein n=1 Tax=Xanthomonas graminis TaxID=3390026 RepID=UPI002541E196|nr:hypothetical protein [Xanthomonas translucens]
MHQFKEYAAAGCTALVIAVALALSGPAAAADNARTFDDIPAQVMTDGFLEAHLDLFYRRAGIRADKKGEFAEAKKHYLLAARYADKPSQARLGEMYWEGQGVAQDRALGFLWMALASERGYDAFTTRKMEYWNQLTPEERQRAIKQDKKMLAEYGDQAAKPRQEAVLRRAAPAACSATPAPPACRSTARAAAASIRKCSTPRNSGNRPRTGNCRTGSGTGARRAAWISARSRTSPRTPRRSRSNRPSPECAATRDAGHVARRG